jgi:hypothetical protein
LAQFEEKENAEVAKSSSVLAQQWLTFLMSCQRLWTTQLLGPKMIVAQATDHEPLLSHTFGMRHASPDAEK